MNKPILLNPFEIIHCVYAEACSGPGWANQPYWVVIEDRQTGKTRIEALQLGDQTDLLLSLHGLAAKLHGMILAEVENKLVRRKK